MFPAFAWDTRWGKECNKKARPLLELTKDTPTTPPTPSDDPQKTSSGSPEALGGKDAPAQTPNDMSQSGEAYPGPRAGGETDKLDPEGGDKVHDPHSV